MAELLLKVGDSGRFKDGDIILAHNDARILDVHAQHICDPRPVGFNRYGLRTKNGMVEKYLQETAVYRFERISRTEVARVNLLTGQGDIVDDNPNMHGESIFVEAFIARQTKFQNHMIFGSPGKEVWYGGRREINDGVIATVWNNIEENTKHRKADHRLWPMTEREKMVFLGVSVTDFDNARADELVAPKLKYGFNPHINIAELKKMKKKDAQNFLKEHQKTVEENTLHRRKQFVNYREIVSTGTVKDIVNPEKAVDIRDIASPYDTGAIVKAKE